MDTELSELSEFEDSKSQSDYGERNSDSSIILEKSTFESSFDNHETIVNQTDKSFNCDVLNNSNSEIVEKSYFESSETDLDDYFINKENDDSNSTTIAEDVDYSVKSSETPTKQRDISFFGEVISQAENSFSSSISEKSCEDPSYFSALSPIATIDSRSPTNFDVYDFEDNEPPPPIRAPSINSDELFEDSSTIEEASDDISVVSSALQTSGCSTASLPFGHLEYEEPMLTTSTPLKPRRKGE